MMNGSKCSVLDCDKIAELLVGFEKPVAKVNVGGGAWATGGRSRIKLMELPSGDRWEGCYFISGRGSCFSFARENK